jgi:biotin carboxyl carrier protein
MKRFILDAVTEEVLYTDDEHTALNSDDTAVEVTFQGDLLTLTSARSRYMFLAQMTAGGVLRCASHLGMLEFKVARGEYMQGDGAGTGGGKTLKSSMPGKIVRVLCKEGDEVEKDQALLIIEAMKMENEIRSPIAGKVTQISAKEGAKVETGALLLKIES